jgi:hypothetical protein
MLLGLGLQQAVPNQRLNDLVALSIREIADFDAPGKKPIVPRSRECGQEVTLFVCRELGHCRTASRVRPVKTRNKKREWAVRRAAHVLNTR